MSDRVYDEMYDDFKILKTVRALSGGVWVTAQCLGYRIQALVFKHHADEPSFELFKTRITKLWVQRIADRQETYNWDRGLDREPADFETEAIVDLASDFLADFIFSGSHG